jgi:hypothetical protein
VVALLESRRALPNNRMKLTKRPSFKRSARLRAPSSSSRASQLIRVFDGQIGEP